MPETIIADKINCISNTKAEFNAEQTEHISWFGQLWKTENTEQIDNKIRQKHKTTTTVRFKKRFFILLILSIYKYILKILYHKIPKKANEI